MPNWLIILLGLGLVAVLALTVAGSLMEKGLIRPVGRKEGPGRPLLYGTTERFLEVFGLKDLKSLPTLKEIEELREG